MALELVQQLLLPVGVPLPAISFDVILLRCSRIHSPLGVCPGVKHQRMQDYLCNLQGCRVDVPLWRRATRIAVMTAAFHDQRFMGN